MVSRNIVEGTLTGMLALTLSMVAGGCEGVITDPAPDQPAGATVNLSQAESVELALAETSGQIGSPTPVDRPVDTGGTNDADGDSSPTLYAYAPSRPVTPVNILVQPHSGWIKAARIWAYFEQWGGWMSTTCLQLPASGVWLNTNLTVPNDVDVFFDGYSSMARCWAGTKDFQWRDHSPVRPSLRNWWLSVY